MKPIRHSCRQHLIAPTVSILIVLTLAGCAGLPFDKPPPRLFVLTPKSVFPENLPTVDWQMTIDLPLAPAGLNTSRIAVHRTPISLDYYEGANWVDTAPKMVQTLLIESFENSRRILGVGRQSVALRADYNLVTELREFQAELRNGGPPDIRVRVNVKLVQFPQRIIVATTSAEAVTRARENQIEDIVGAFDDSLGKVLKDIVTWTLQAVPAAPPSTLVR
jgi:cholesterol transport system auxiliary component